MGRPERVRSADELDDNFFAWKWEAATTADGAIARPRDGHRPAGHLLPHRPLRAGRPADRPRRARRDVGDVGRLHRVGEQYMANAPKGSAFIDSASGLYNAIIGQSEIAVLRRGRQPDLRLEPGRARTPGTSPSRRSQAGLTAKLEQFDQAWNQALRQRRLRHHRLSRVDDRLHQGPGRRRRRGQVGRRQHPGGDGGNWGGSYLSIPAASENQEEAYELIQWLTAPEQQVKMWTNAQHFPSSSTAAADGSVAAATDDYFSGAPIGEIFKESADDLPIAHLGPKDGVIKDTISPGAQPGRPAGRGPRERLGSRPWTRSRTRSGDPDGVLVASSPHAPAAPYPLRSRRRPPRP